MTCIWGCNYGDECCRIEDKLYNSVNVNSVQYDHAIRGFLFKCKNIEIELNICTDVYIMR